MLLVLSLPVAAGAAPRQKLNGSHVPAAVAHLAPTGSLPGTQKLKLAIGLPLRNQEELSDFLRQLYDPASPNYHRYLTPEEFTARFGPAAKDYQALMDFVRSNGLTVTVTHPNRVVLDVEGAVTDIQKALHLTLRTYRHPREAREFYAPDAEPSVDLAVPILHISGLDNYSLPHPNFRIKPASASVGATPQVGSGPGGSYRGDDFRNAYVPGTALNGASQTVGLLQFDGFYTNDIATYAGRAGLRNIPLTVVRVNGGATNITVHGSEEVSLDIEMVMSMAPGLSGIYVYEAPNSLNFFDDLLSRMANDNLSRQLSCSWGDTVPGRTDPTAEQIFQQMAAQGQSFFQASGDSDAFTGSIPFPSDSPNITQVGGTTLTTGSDGGYSSETVWNFGGTNGGSSGGISTFYAIPSYQQGISMAANQGSTAMRNVPDVALTADDVYVVYGNGKANIVGGTSVAAPLWAGFTALINQQAATIGLAPVGFMNPALYTICKGANYTNAFHDITTGNSFSSDSPSSFSAVPGYDLCTGWGTPNGTNLINLLNAPAPWIISQPESQAVKAGDSVTFSVTSKGKAPLGYQWFFDGKPISTATSYSYSIARVQSIQAGTYSVAVSNSFGSAMSAPATLVIDSGTALGVIGAPFGYQITPVNGATWYSASGLPPGLVCSGGSGFISGTPTETGTFWVHLEARNLGGIVWSTTIPFTIADGAINSSSSAEGILWVPFTYQIIADNSPTWYSASGLPSGLLCGASGSILGTPTQTGAFSVHVEARNLFQTVSSTISLIIRDPAISSATRVIGIAGAPFGYQITADNGATWYSASGLPSGLRCDSSGLISGTPTQTGAFLVHVEARNYWGRASATIFVTIVAKTASVPALTILRAGDNVFLTWPLTSDGFVLEETKVQPIAWTNSSIAVVVQGNENMAAIATGGTAKFYRLRK